MVHVQPPNWILERMLAVRLHLDDCTEANGALRVIPGSHQSGRLRDAEIEIWRAQYESLVCEVASGGALLMRPLLLHSSGKATTAASRRRVLHLEFAACELPEPLAWPV